MLATTFLLLLLPGLIQYPQPAGDGCDEATRERMQQRAEFLHQQMAGLLQELQQQDLQQSSGAWGALLLWQLWALLGMLLLLSALCFGLRKLRPDPGNSSQKESCGSNVVVSKTEIDSNTSVEEDNKGGDEEGSYADAQAESSIGNALQEDGHNSERNLGSPSEGCTWLPLVDLDRGCWLIMDLMDNFTHVFQCSLSNSVYPVPQEAIGVGSSFEGWSPQGEDALYSVLVPLSPPPGHAFHLEPDAAALLQRGFFVRVEQLCTCSRERQGQDGLCSLHLPEEEGRRRAMPSLLHNLCTGAYLDVEKTVQWFSRFLGVAWQFLPQARHWRLMVQPSSRSCKLQLSKGSQSFTAQLILGVRQGDSDIFASSLPTGGGLWSIMWLQSCCVAEAEFFRHVSRLAPQDSCHCKCLQLLSGFLLAEGFATYALKTVLMHLLNTIPLTQWRSRDFSRRLKDILKFLCCSLEAKHLNHFVIGNQRFPLEISLPSGFRVAEPPNLFQRLARDPDAHRKAMQGYFHLLHELKHLCIQGF